MNQNEAFKNQKLLDLKSQQIQETIQSLQNGIDGNKNECNYSNLVVYDSKNGCGYGCQLHGVAQSLIVAYNQNRTLAISSTDFPGEKSYETFFEPISKRCSELKPSFNKKSKQR